ncbi:hypothetical protein IAU59_005501 [Kwoniella sp. CBS 9459]
MVKSALVLSAIFGMQLASAAAVTTTSASQCSPSTTTKVITSTSTVTVTKASTVTATKTITIGQAVTSSQSTKSDGKSSTSGAISASLVSSKASSVSQSTTGKSTAKSSTTPTTKSSSNAVSASDDRLVVTPTTVKTTAVSTSQASASATTRIKFTPSLSTSFIYDLDNQPIDAPIIETTSGLALNKTMYIVDMANSTPEQIANYHAKGKKVGCYFSAGTWEPFRADKLQFLPECYCGTGVAIDSDGKCTGKGSDNNLLGEWGEWWLDLRSTKCLNNVKGIMTKRIQEAASKGCDAIDPDNVDSFMNQQNFGNTAQNEVDYLLWLATTAKANNLAIDLKNSGTLLTDPDTGKSTKWTDSLVKAFDFNVIESCHQYDECHTYDPFLKAGKPQIQIEYSNSIKKCPTLAAGQNLLVYSGTTVDSKKITLSCP